MEVKNINTFEQFKSYLLNKHKDVSLYKELIELLKSNNPNAVGAKELEAMYKAFLVAKKKLNSDKLSEGLVKGVRSLLHTLQGLDETDRFDERADVQVIYPWERTKKS